VWLAHNFVGDCCTRRPPHHRLIFSRKICTQDTSCMVACFSFFLLFCFFSSSYSLLRRYDQASSQCHRFSSPVAKQLLFFDARLELNLSIPLPSLPTSHPSPSTLRSHLNSRFLRNDVCLRTNFLNSIYGALTFQLNQSNSIITYGRVFKVNSENIVDSLLKSSRDSPTLFNASFTGLNHALGAIDYQELTQHIQQQYHLKKSPIFSFFRHPIHHFLSGITESQFRSACRVSGTDLTNPAVHRCVENKKNTLVVSDEQARNILDLVFSCDWATIRESLWSTEHFSPQSTTLHEWKPQFIGYLENFTSYWSELEVGVLVLFVSS
jgi:hypothetical protein